MSAMVMKKAHILSVKLMGNFKLDGWANNT